MPEFDVRRVAHAEAKPFIEHWHYSRSCPTGFNIFFGAYIDGLLYAVAAYGSSANMDKGASVARLTKHPVRYQNITSLARAHRNVSVDGLTVGPRNCLELRRLCRQGEKHAALIPLTRFLSICHRMLKREEGIEYIISYSDPGELRTERVDGKWRVVAEQQNTGGIYRAANFRHIGRTDATPHNVRDEDGVVIHRRNPYREMQRWNAKHPDEPKSLAEIRAERGLSIIVTPPKERWFLAL